MAALIRFPKVGANVTEGTVGAWRMSEGESVARGQALVELITSKATFEVESDTAGILKRILAPEKSIVPVGYVLAVVGELDETMPDADAENEKVMARFRAAATTAEGKRASASNVRATPGARRLARELGVDLGRVTPSAEGGVIKEEDVRRAAGP